MWESVKHRIEDSNIAALYFFKKPKTKNSNPDSVNTLQVEVAAGLLGFYLSQASGSLIMSKETNTQVDTSVLMHVSFVIKKKKSKAAYLNESKRC